MTIIKLLDPIQNSALGLVTVAYALTLASLRFIIVASHSQLKFLTFILQHRQTTTFNHVFHPPHNLRPDHNLQTHLNVNLTISSNFALSIRFSLLFHHGFFPLLWSTHHSLSILKPQRHLQSTEDSFKKSSTFSKNQPNSSPTAQKFITDLASHTK